MAPSGRTSLVPVALAATLLAALPACTRHVLREADPSRGVRLPADHAAHADAQTEWWHFHAHLVDEKGRRYDCFLAFIRQHTDLDRILFVPIRFFVDPFHVSYFIVNDRTRGEFHLREKHSYPDVWTASASEAALRLRHDSWSARARDDGAIELHASTLSTRLGLELRALKPPSLPGRSGYLDVPPRSAHYYYSVPRMAAVGELTVDGERHRVRGLGWLKHEWGFFYSPHIEGWTWFGIQLSSGHELEIALIFDNDWGLAEGSFAGVDEPDGRLTQLAVRTIGVSESGAIWRSPSSGVVYPVGWVIEIPGRGTLTLRAAPPAQEIRVFPANAWAGALEVRGVFDGRPVVGDCFGEVVGLHRPFGRALLKSGHPTK
jgi:predicted secreted hydrolase